MKKIYIIENDTKARHKSLWDTSRVFFILTTVIFLIAALIMLLIDCTWYGWIIFCFLFTGVIIFHRTKKWTGRKKLVIFIASTLFLMTNLIMTRPDLGVSLAGTLAREGVRFAINLPDIQGNKLLSFGVKYATSESIWQPPKGYSNTKYDIGFPVELLSDEDGDPDKVILHFHGGAYVIGFMDIYRNIALRYSKLSGGSSVLSVDYRTAPLNTFPAALVDAVKTWDWLITNGYQAENIVVVGDSAGGNLALALVEFLRDEGRELPKAMICMSPWTDMAGTGASYSYNRLNDPMYKVISDESAHADETSMKFSYQGDANPYNKYLSPKYGDFTGFPPMLLQVGSYEVLESDSIAIYDKAKANGVNVTLTRYHGMFHSFQLFEDILPESRQSWLETERFLKLYL